MGGRLRRPPPSGDGQRVALDRPHQPRTAGLLRRTTAAAFVVAPLLFLVDNLLHPKEYTRDHEREQLAEIAANYDRWQLAHLIGFVALIGFVVAALGLAALVRERRPQAGLIGGALSLLGLLALAAVIALDGFTWGVLGEVSSRGPEHAAVAEEALREIQQSEWSLQYYLPALAFLIGMPVLAITAARSGVLPAPVGYLLVLGSVLIGTEGLIVSNAYYVVGAAVMLVAGVSVAWALQRTSEAPPQPSS